MIAYISQRDRIPLDIAEQIYKKMEPAVLIRLELEVDGPNRSRGLEANYDPFARG